MKKSKKLLILVPNLTYFISHRMPIAETASKKGYKVIVGYGELGGANPKKLNKKNFKIISIPIQRGGTNPFNEIKTFFYIFKFFKREKPDIVHLVTIKPYLYGGVISRLIGTPCLVSAVSGLGSLFIHKDLKSIIYRLLLYPIYKLAFNHKNQTVIFQNRDDAKVLINWNVLNKQKVKLTRGSGVNLENFTNFDEPSGLPVVCFAARLLKDKGVYEFVSAAKLLKNRGVKAKFCIAGNVDTSNPSGLDANDIKKIKKEGIIEILGYQKNIPKLYSKIHIVCLPSYREGLPKSLIEAAAASRAVVTTDVPGCRDAIIPKKTGLLVPVKDPQKLADSLQWLIEQPQERIAMGKAGRIFAEKEFPIEKIVQDHLETYQQLLKKVL